MIPNWNDIDIAREHFEDMVREIRHERFAAEVEARSAPAAVHRGGPIKRTLARLGRVLVVWGMHLEAMAPSEPRP